MTTLQIRNKGTITLPAALRRKYGLDEGEILTLIDLGEGTFLLRPYHSRVDDLSDKIRTRLEAKGETLESMLQTLHEVQTDYANKQEKH